MIFFFFTICHKTSREFYFIIFLKIPHSWRRILKQQKAVGICAQADTRILPCLCRFCSKEGCWTLYNTNSKKILYNTNQFKLNGMRLVFKLKLKFDLI